MKGPERIVRRSVLDRLLQTGEPEPSTWAASVQAVRRAVLRDVEWLLNTRRIAGPPPGGRPETQRSVYYFGLPDVTSVSADSPTMRRQLLRDIQTCIERFEPRLGSVRVSEVEPRDGASRRHLRFAVEALLELHPESEPITFSTTLEPGSGRFNVSGSD